MTVVPTLSHILITCNFLSDTELEWPINLLLLKFNKFHRIKLATIFSFAMNVILWLLKRPQFCIRHLYQRKMRIQLLTIIFALKSTDSSCKSCKSGGKAYLFSYISDRHVFSSIFFIFNYISDREWISKRKLVVYSFKECLFHLMQRTIRGVLYLQKETPLSCWYWR